MSKPERQLGEVLRTVFPHHRIVTQHPIKIGRRRTLYLDFYIPLMRMAFEYDGRQHDTFVSHFHGNRADFDDAVYRDALKTQWCEDNGIRLIRFSHTETITPESIRAKLIATEQEETTTDND